MGSLFMTGASGFVGRHFLSKYADQFDRIILPLRKTPEFEIPKNAVVRKIIGTSDEIAGLLRAAPCDFVLNSAAYGITPSAREEEQMIAVNTELPVQLARAAQDIGAKKFVQLGTMSEYRPIESERPTRETDTLIEAVKGYGASKAAATQKLKTLSETGKTHISCLRLFGIFGPGEGPHRLLVSLYRTLSNGQTAPMSAGTQVRDFIYIYDVIDAIYRAIKQPLNGTFSVFNIGSGQGTSVGDFAKMFCGIGGFRPDQLDLGALPMRDTDVAYIVANIEAAKQGLDWSPKWSTEAAIEHYLKYLSIML